MEIFTFILNYHPVIIGVALLLMGAYYFYDTNLVTHETTEAEDRDLMSLYIYRQASLRGQKLPKSAYGEWSKHTIRG